MGGHATSVIEGIWPELVARWKLQTITSGGPLCSGGTSVAQYSGLGYMATLHLDKQDVGMSASLNLWLDSNVPEYCNCMAIPGFRVRT